MLECRNGNVSSTSDIFIENDLGAIQNNFLEKICTFLMGIIYLYLGAPAQ